MLPRERYYISRESYLFHPYWTISSGSDFIHPTYSLHASCGMQGLEAAGHHSFQCPWKEAEVPLRPMEKLPVGQKKQIVIKNDLVF